MHCTRFYKRNVCDVGGKRAHGFKIETLCDAQ